MAYEGRKRTRERCILPKHSDCGRCERATVGKYGRSARSSRDKKLLQVCPIKVRRIATDPIHPHVTVGGRRGSGNWAIINHSSLARKAAACVPSFTRPPYDVVPFHFIIVAHLHIHLRYTCIYNLVHFHSSRNLIKRRSKSLLQGRSKLVKERVPHVHGTASAVEVAWAVSAGFTLQQN